LSRLDRKREKEWRIAIAIGVFSPLHKGGVKVWRVERDLACEPRVLHVIFSFLSPPFLNLMIMYAYPSVFIYRYISQHMTKRSSLLASHPSSTAIPTREKRRSDWEIEHGFRVQIRYGSGRQ
jgi:hypothetical protein